MHRLYFLLFAAGLYLLLDWYVFQAIKVSVSEWSEIARKSAYILYFVLSFGLFAGVMMYNQMDPKVFKDLRLVITSGFFILLVGKLFVSLFLLLDDVRRGITFLIGLFPQVETKPDLSRSRFVTNSALVAGAVPIAVFSMGILSGAHDYRVRKRVIHSKKLPKAFDGIRIAQISDIHTGSFFNKTAVKGGVDLINAQKADVVFFTGDLVNNMSEEAKPYLDIFKHINAPFGVYSTMGNHDYGDYNQWSSQNAKQKDIQQLHGMHKYMGWNIMLNEHTHIRTGADQIAILGVENWGAGRFSKYGDLDKTYSGLDPEEFKILLSHDPSHWDAQVRQQFPDIDLMLAGHTHGMQFGIEIGNFRWSPSQYIYKQWADLYQEGAQYLYVNRGFGFLGYPGRVGILPEITVIELKSA